MKKHYIFTVLAMLSLLTGCDSSQLSGSIPLQADRGTEAQRVEVANVPILQLRAEQIATGRSGTYILQDTNGSVEAWRSSDGTGLAIEEGFITATFGLGFDLISADASETMALLDRGISGDALRIHRYLDGENQIVTRAFRCTVSIQSTLPGFREIREDCVGIGLNFENLFVLNSNNEIVTSSQFVSPEVGSIGLTRPRPAAQPISSVLEDA